MSGLDPIVAATMVQRVADRAAIPTSVPTATYGPQGPFAPGQNAGDTSAQSDFSSTASTSTLSDLARLLDVLARAGGGVAPPVTNASPLIAQPWPDSLPDASSATVPGAAPGTVAASLSATAASGSPRVGGTAASAERSDATARLALALSAALEDSGLFYEAHLAQWLAGARSTESILRQPQARLLPTLPPTTAAAAAAVAVPAPVAPARAGAPPASVDWILEDDLLLDGPGSAASWSSAARGNEALARVLDEPRQTYSFWRGGGGYAHPSAHGQGDGLGGGGFAGHGAALPGAALDTSGGNGSDDALTTFLLPAVMHPDAVGLVQQQLDLLSTSQFRWAGEAWPGMRFEWSVEPYDADNAQRAGADRSWRTRVRLSLPELGHLEADLVLSGDTLLARLESRAAVTPVLSAGSEAFRDRLALAGIHLSGLTISGRQDVGDDAVPLRPDQRGWR
jgi:hypothetical protein